MVRRGRGGGREEKRKENEHEWGEEENEEEEEEEDIVVSPVTTLSPEFKGPSLPCPSIIYFHSTSVWLIWHQACSRWSTVDRRKQSLLSVRKGTFVVSVW